MRSEDFIADRGRPFTGAEYMESLRDGREVYFDGKRVSDITTHPAFRNSVRSIARLYDALHDPKTRDLLTCPTDTGSGGYTHKYFRVARSRDDMRGAQQAIAGWARLTYGWMGRTPDYKAAFSNTLGGFPEYYGAYADNARNWYKRAQEAMPFMNHAIVNPPIDRHRPPEEVKDVYACVKKETDAGIFVSGAKVVATSAAMTHYNFMGQSSKTARCSCSGRKEWQLLLLCVRKQLVSFRPAAVIGRSYTQCLRRVDFGRSPDRQRKTVGSVPIDPSGVSCPSGECPW